MSPVVLDFGSQAAYAQALLPEIVLAVTAMTVLLVDVFQRGPEGGSSSDLVGRLAVAGLLAAAAANAWLFALEAAPGSKGLVALDDFRAVSNFVLLGGALLALLLAEDYLEREGLKIGEFHALLLFATMGMMVLVGAQDLVVTFLGLETMSIAAYVLTAFNRQDPRSAEAGLKYFLIGAFASSFLIYGIALLYGATGTTHLPSMAPAVTEGVQAGSPLLLGGIGLLLVGFGFKVSAVPFHMWAPDAYQGAPTPVTGYMAAGVKAAAFLALLRVLAVHLEPAADIWGTVTWWLAMLTMIVPNLVALAQDDVKRMLAYSSVAHAGYVLVGVTAGGTAGLSASLFYLGVYTLMTLGAFGITYLVAGKGDRRSHLADFRGLGWSRPVLGAAMLLFLLSLAGFPPTGGFVGKLFLLRAAVDAGQLTLAVTLVLTSLVAYYYYLRVVWKMYFDEAPAGAVVPSSPGRSFRVAALACAAGVLAAGVVPGPALGSAERAVDGLWPAAAARAGEPVGGSPGREPSDRSETALGPGPALGGAARPGRSADVADPAGSRGEDGRP